MPIGDFLGIIIVGAALSFVIQWIKTKWKADGTKIKLLTLGLAIVVGGIYFFLRDTQWWQPTIGVLGAASTVYAFFLKK